MENLTTDISNFYDFAEVGKPSSEVVGDEFTSLRGSLLDLAGDGTSVEEQSVDLQQLIDRAIVEDSTPGAPSTAQLFPDLLTTTPMIDDGPPDKPQQALYVIENNTTVDFGNDILSTVSTMPSNVERDVSGTLLSLSEFNVPSAVSEPATPASTPAKTSLKAPKSRRKVFEKGTTEYVERRERNNIAVRKSRDKAKQRQSETSHKVVELTEKNQELQKKVDLLSKELSVLKSLFANVGVNFPSEYKHLLE